MSTLAKFIDAKSDTKLNQHEKIIFKNIQLDLQGREVLFGAEERVGQTLEKVRQANITERQ